MQRIILFLIAIMTMSTIDAQTLTERHKGLAACACLMAQGDMNRLEPVVRVALDKGVTVNELKEQREQSDARISSAESRQKSSETQWCEPVDDATYNLLTK